MYKTNIVGELVLTQFDVYCPHTIISDVTDYIVSIICDGVIRCGYKINRISGLRGTRENKRKGIIVIEGDSAIKAKLAGYGFVIYWVQGILPEESYMKHKSRIRRAVLSVLEYYALYKGDLIIFVSEQMREHFIRKYRYNPRNYYIIPCFNAEIDRENFTDERYKNNVFLYAGRLSTWQCFERTVKLYKEIETRMTETKLLILTHEQKKAKQILKDYQIRNFEVDFVSVEELPERMRNCKFGFCLRDKNEVNWVATPTKLSTYVSSGIIPIYSNVIGSFSETAKNNKFCLCENDGDFMDRIAELCNSNITGEEVLDSYERTFGKYYSKRQHGGVLRRLWKRPWGQRAFISNCSHI